MACDGLWDKLKDEDGKLYPIPLNPISLTSTQFAYSSVFSSSTDINALFFLCFIAVNVALPQLTTGNAEQAATRLRDTAFQQVIRLSILLCGSVNLFGTK